MATEQGEFAAPPLLNYIVRGTGKPLLILHGFLGSSDNWVTPAKAWQSDYQCHLIDLRNHGRSFHSDEWNYEIMANDVIRLADELQLANFDLLGHSMGAKTAMFICQQFPERVNRLIAVDMSPRQYPAHHDKVLKALTEFDPTQFDSRSEADQAMKAYLPDLGERLFILKNLERHEKAFRWRSNIPLFIGAYSTLNRAVPGKAIFDKPTLFIRGGKSNYVTDQDVLDIRRRFSNSRVITLKKAGHWVHAEAPEDFQKTVAYFLEKA